MAFTLKNHPFAVEAFFERSLVLTYAVPKEDVAHLIPECLQLDVFEDKWAFVAVAMVQTKDLRPKGFPHALGNDFFLIGYRVFVQYHTNEGKRLRGLYILKSETNKRKMQFFGNIFTHYQYTTTDITQRKEGGHVKISSVTSGLEVDVNIGIGDVPLPQTSPFATWKEARRYAGPLPFTFTYNKETKEVLIIEGVRQHWEPRPVVVQDQKVVFINKLGLQNALLANAFVVENIPYCWKKGRIEQWKG